MASFDSVVLTKLHERPIGRHYGISTTIKKILTMGYWWLTIQRDVA